MVRSIKTPSPTVPPASRLWTGENTGNGREEIDIMDLAILIVMVVVMVALQFYLDDRP